MYFIHNIFIVLSALIVIRNHATETHLAIRVTEETKEKGETTLHHTTLTSVSTTQQAWITSDIERNCTNCLSGCNFTNGHCEGKCSSGYYGSNCDKKCSPKCSEQSGCDINSGTCISCAKPYYGSKCQHECPSSCLYGCDSSGTCFGCQGYRYGAVCNMTCPGNCNLGCEQINGTCMYGCKLGYSGWTCTTPCPPNCVTSLGCKQGEGSCFKCTPGYGGKKGDCSEKCYDLNCSECLNDPSKCLVCKEGWYGDKCSMPCSKNCINSQCNKVSGQCTCAIGWIGESCDQQCIDKCDICTDNETCLTCSQGFYGSVCNFSCPSECGNCSYNGKCEICNDKFFGEECKCRIDKCKMFNGSSCDGCIDNQWYPSGKGCCPYSPHCRLDHATNGTCIGGCKAGYWGEACWSTCSAQCDGGGDMCNSTTGHCLHGCTDGWYTAKCDFECSMEIPNCKNCTEADGKVFCSVCDKGYHLVVDKCVSCSHCLDDECDSMSGLCTKGCKQGYYDSTGKRYRCEQKCHTGCAEDDCNFETGECLKGCKTGYTGVSCQMKCPPHCMNDTCYHDTGYCKDGCEPGYFRGNCTDTCGHCMNVSCDQVIGTCIGCDVGYYGELCDQLCDYCKDGLCEQYTGECKNGCSNGMYGNSCNSTCVDKCDLCDENNAQCIKCQTGFSGSKCDIPCSPNCLNGACESRTNYCTEGCRDEFYGVSCSQKCNATCLDGSCDDKTGRCIKGCKSGWLGDHCDVKTSAIRSKDREIHDVNIGATVGAAFGSAGLVVIVVLIVYYLRKRKRRRNPGFYHLNQREY